jgi:hypothetical protein
MKNARELDEISGKLQHYMELTKRVGGILEYWVGVRPKSTVCIYRIKLSGNPLLRLGALIVTSKKPV